MTILLIILLSIIFTIIFITFHLLFLYFFSFKKTIQIIIPFVLSNLIFVYFVKEMGLYKLFYNSFIINLAILIIYMQFFNVLKMGFTLAIITLFKKKRNYFIKN